MKSIWPWVLGAILVWPVHATVVRVNGRPVDLVLSDLLVILLPFASLLWKASAPTTQPAAVVKGDRWTPRLAAACLVYILVLASIGLWFSGEWLRLLSAMKLAKPILFVFVGLMMATWINPIRLIGIVSQASAIVVVVTLAHTLADPAFPTCPWGKYFLGFEVSGYPNSPMSFFAVFVPLLLAASDYYPHPRWKLAGRILAGLSALIVIASLSRSSALALFCSTGVYFVLTGRWRFLLGCALAFSLMSVIGLGLLEFTRKSEVVTKQVEIIENRIVKSEPFYDPSNGRLEIWQFVLHLASERPVFGYLFEPLSRHMGDVETPHQQYLELLYKCGGVGLLMYLALLASCLVNTRRLLLKSSRGSVGWYQLCGLAGLMVGVLVGNITQSNLTYSLTGNVVFLMFGSLCSARADDAIAAGASTPVVVADVIPVRQAA